MIYYELFILKNIGIFKGWTLLLTNTASGRNWMPDNIKERNADSPGLNIEYSILEIGDNIRKKSEAAEFEVNNTIFNSLALKFPYLGGTIDILMILMILQ